MVVDTWVLDAGPADLELVIVSGSGCNRRGLLAQGHLHGLWLQPVRPSACSGHSLDSRRTVIVPRHFHDPAVVSLLWVHAAADCALLIHLVWARIWRLSSLTL
jgi:hypothetical protein